MTTVDTVLTAPARRRAARRPSVAMAVLTIGLLLCVAGYAAVAVVLIRFAAQLFA